MPYSGLERRRSPRYLCSHLVVVLTDIPLPKKDAARWIEPGSKLRVGKYVHTDIRLAVHRDTYPYQNTLTYKNAYSYKNSHPYANSASQRHPSTFNRAACHPDHFTSSRWIHRD